MSQKFYITTTLPYVNAKPHLGFAIELVQADIIARHRKLSGDEVFFNTGTDDHGQKIFINAQKEGLEPKAFADKNAVFFKELVNKLSIADSKSGITSRFIRTTDPDHIKAVQEFWKRCEKDIYKKEYKVKYCIGCELEKTDSELEDGKCSTHPNLEIQIIEEENYFFAFSKYKDQLLELYEDDSFIVPKTKRNEIRSFIERGAQDFSISRLKEKMPWGVPVPGDDEHVMYVWFDALINYISTIGWPDESYNDWWPGVQIAGKDNLRQQSAMWQAMLMSAGIKTSRQIIIHGFITSGGQKMSKSLGNVIDPFEVIEKYGVDAVRYYLAREISTFKDGDFTIEHFEETYNAHLANGLGNLVSRIMKMAETHLERPVEIPQNTIPEEFKDFLDKYEIQKATDVVWEYIAKLDGQIQETEPFKLVKENKEKAVEIIKNLVIDLYTIGQMLSPLLPHTSEVIKKMVKENKMPEPLFKRID